VKDKASDETIIKCPNCLHKYSGKYVNNPYELQGICDWCALAVMVRDCPPLPPMKIEVGVIDENGYRKTGERWTEPPPPKPSEVN
jgi:hypothetical protein